MAAKLAEEERLAEELRLANEKRKLEEARLAEAEAERKCVQVCVLLNNFFQSIGTSYPNTSLLNDCRNSKSVLQQSWPRSKGYLKNFEEPRRKERRRRHVWQLRPRGIE
jgi:hypothetical protein